MENSITPGKYRHYKGNDYQIYGVARHSETQEPLVVYRALYGKCELWVRPLAMFKESVMVNGEEILRFNLIAKDDSAGADLSVSA